MKLKQNECTVRIAARTLFQWLGSGSVAARNFSYEKKFSGSVAARNRLNRKLLVPNHSSR